MSITALFFLKITVLFFLTALFPPIICILCICRKNSVSSMAGKNVNQKIDAWPIDRCLVNGVLKKRKGKKNFQM